MTRPENFAEFQTRARQSLDNALAACIDECSDGQVCRAARYAVLGGGQRWRGLATIASGRVFDPDASQTCLPLACGIELAHATTLVLDDLPSMDDAKVRRGKPCTHLVFPAWAVDIAPAFLVNLAYDVILRNRLVSPDRRLAAAAVLTAAVPDLSLGQEMDLAVPTTGDWRKEMLKCYRLKTGVLFAAALKSGAVLCGADEDAASTLYDAGMDLGVAFQLHDDLADSRCEPEQSQGNSRHNAVNLLGYRAVEELRDGFARKAIGSLASLGSNAETLRSIMVMAANHV